MLKTSRSTPKRSSTQIKTDHQINTLAIDIGGTGLKASVLDEEGTMLTERVRVDTPPQCPPELMVETLAQLVANLPEYHRVSVGFPGVIRHGVVLTAHNLGTRGWHGFALDKALAKRLGKPVRVLNDADVQGLGAITGMGVELVITLGTGMGSSLFEDGRLAPHLELAHHPFRKDETYEEQLVPLELVGQVLPPTHRLRPPLPRRRQCGAVRRQPAPGRNHRIEQPRNPRRHLALARARHSRPPRFRIPTEARDPSPRKACEKRTG